MRARSEYAGPVPNPVRVERIVKAALAIAMITLVVWFFASGTYQTLSAERLREHIRGLDELGPVVFVLAFALIQPLGPSGHIFTICASLVWPPAVAFGLSLAGAVCAQTLGFVFFRYVARDFARERIPSRVQKYEQNLVDRPFRTVVLIRLVTFTWPLMSMVLGVSRVRFVPMLFATIVGLAPGIAFDVFLGAAALEWLAD